MRSATDDGRTASHGGHLVPTRRSRPTLTSTARTFVAVFAALALILAGCASSRGSDTVAAGEAVSTQGPSTDAGPAGQPAGDEPDASIPLDTGDDRNRNVEPNQDGSPSDVPGTDAEAEVSADDTVVISTGPVAARDRFRVSGSGIDGSSFGDGADEVIGALTSAHGAPLADSGWGPVQAPCEGLGDAERTVEWEAVVVVLADGPTAVSPSGGQHLRALTTNDAVNPGLVTLDDGEPLLETTIADLQARYPGTTVEEHELLGPHYVLPDGLNGEATGTGPDDRVQTFRAGLICID
jgi:hypothetical protein